MMPGASTPLRGIALALLLPASLSLAGCDRHMVFAERTGVNVLVSMGQDVDRPLHVNMGVERRILAFSPPTEGFTYTQNGRKHAKGDAASLLSGFEMQYKKGSDPFDGEVSVSTQFASGMAAREAAKSSALGTGIMAAQSRRAWYRLPSDASLATLQARINQAESERGRLVAIEVDDDETVFEIATGTPPANRITLQTGDVSPAANQTSVATGNALIDGTTTRVTAVRSQTQTSSGAAQTN